MKFGLSTETLLKIVSVFAKHSVHQIKIFGSRAMGNFKEGSDIDLAVFEEVNFMQLNKIKNELDDLNLPYTFNLCLYHDIQNLALKNHIDQEGLWLTP